MVQFSKPPATVGTPTECIKSTPNSNQTDHGSLPSTAFKTDAHSAFIRASLPRFRRRGQRPAPAHVSVGFRFLDSRLVDEGAHRVGPRSLLLSAEGRRDSVASWRYARF